MEASTEALHAAILGSMILDPACIKDVVVTMGQKFFNEDFDSYPTKNELVFVAIMAVYFSGKKIDLVSIRDSLLVSGILKEAGGVEYLAKVVDAVPETSKVLDYVRALSDGCIELKNEVDNVIEERKKEADAMYIKEDFLILNYVYPYEIKLSRLNSPGKILGWINQLSTKTWMSSQRISRFARLAFRQIGIEIDFNI